MIHPTAMIDKDAEIQDNVEIGPYSIIGAQVKIESGTVIGAHVVVEPYVNIGNDCRIFQFSSIGAAPQDLKFKGEITHVEIGDNATIREFVTINRGTGFGGGLTKIGSGCLLMAYSHVAHDCIIGKDTILVNAATLGGHVILGDYVTVGGLTGVQQFVRIGDYAYIGGQCGVRNDIPPYVRAAGGEKIKLVGINTIKLGRCGFPEETVSTLKASYRILFRSKSTLKESILKLKKEVDLIPEVDNLINFIESSELGITR